MNSAEKLEEVKRLCQSIIDYRADFTPSDDHYDLAEMILAIINNK
jgi:hypothetical protein